MAYFRTIPAHVTCKYIIQDYLERDGRAIGHDYINIDSPQWAEQMDTTRELHGNDATRGQFRAVCYRHFVLSPDPKDDITLDGLRELTLAWAHEFFGTCEKNRYAFDDERYDPYDDRYSAGKLGSYEVAIVYHNDNESGIPHAHVVVNNTDLDSGKRMKLDNKMYQHISDRFQEMCAERGLSYFTPEDSKRKESVYRKGNFRTEIERRRIKDKKRSWKEELRQMIYIAAHSRTSMDDYFKVLAMQGVEVKEKRGDLIYTHPGYAQRSVYGYRLGRSYALETIKEAVAETAQKQSAADKITADRVALIIASIIAVASGTGVDHYKLAEAGISVDSVDLAPVGKLAVDDVAGLLKINREYNIRCLGDYTAEIDKRMYKVKEKLGIGPVLLRYEQEARLLINARKLAKELGVFDGVEGKVTPRKFDAALTLKVARAASDKPAKARRRSTRTTKEQAEQHAPRRSLKARQQQQRRTDRRSGQR